MCKSRVSGEAIGLTERNTIKHSNKKVTSQLLEITCIYFQLVRVESCNTSDEKKDSSRLIAKVVLVEGDKPT